MPVTSGTVAFTRGNTLIGDRRVGPDGTATHDHLLAAPEERRASRRRTPATPTIMGRSARSSSRGSTGPTPPRRSRPPRRRSAASGEQELVAAVDAIGLVGVNPAGTVVFRRNGRVIGRVGLAGGTAVLVLPAYPRSRPVRRDVPGQPAVRRQHVGAADPPGLTGEPRPKDPSMRGGVA